ncbi:protein N-terminal glutamine amidohydrolase [Lepeophtheirus salmonis]|uniref:Protein N-terminal glutamine amidohydrolase n=1 Tax=Lepeophtheirus salmonis TaxID=72036 RepID=D3PGL7_LEPSM|nr:protein N-terminal glutamine amidohydrolase-like [Lepeophtheirus salmonis]ADD24413.1 Protein N-terminal glutamine amidohydrolase [Lepeophtheirus salmonis]
MSSSPQSVSGEEASTSRLNGSGPVVHSLTANPKDRDLTHIVPLQSRCSYHPCFCEENVWKVVDEVRSRAPGELSKTSVIFVSNKKQVVPLWRQKAGREDDKLVIWDYHVIFIYKPDERCLVYDLDSELPFPTYFHKYVTETFRTDAILNPEYHRFFRIIPGGVFLEHFASDRRHMKKSDGTWVKDPPPYPCILPSRDRNDDDKTPSSVTHNLDKYISMEQSNDDRFGQVLGLQDFIKKFFSR